MTYIEFLQQYKDFLNMSGISKILELRYPNFAQVVACHKYRSINDLEDSRIREFLSQMKKDLNKIENI